MNYLVGPISVVISMSDELYSTHCLNYQGNYRDAAACYERAIQEDPNELVYHEVLPLLFLLN